MKPIIALVDFSDVTAAVVRQATELARAMKCGICLLHVAPPDPEFVGYEAGPKSVRDTVAQKIRAEHHAIQELEAGVRKQGVDVQALLVQGPTVERALAEIERLGASLVVMGSHGRGALHHLLVGSVTEGVLRKAKCPVVVVPSRGA